MALNWNGQAMAGEAKEQAAKRILRAVVFFQIQHQARLSVSNPRPYLTPSRPGEYPRKRTGNLIGSVLYSPATIADLIAGDLRVRIGLPASAGYGLILEVARQRKGFRDTMEALRPQIEAILLRKA